MIGRDIGHDHVDCQSERVETRRQSEDEQDAAHELQRRYEMGSQSRRGQAQAGEEFRDLVEVVQLSPPRLLQLPSPVKPHEQ